MAYSAETRTTYRVCYENKKERDCFEDLEADGRIVLQWISRIGQEGVDKIYLA